MSTGIKAVARGESVRVLADVSFEVAGGEAVSIIGASGSGKSTPLHLLGGLDAPSEGAVSCNAKACAELLRASNLSLKTLLQSVMNG